jgi:Leu/Phe-tRNA-protein transferase
MSDVSLSIKYLPLDALNSLDYLKLFVYSNKNQNYYWCDDYTPEYYILQAQRGFIAVTERVKNKELLIPEIQFNYALLDFKDLHISRKVAKLLKKENLEITIDQNFELVYSGIKDSHKNCWLTPKYIDTLKEANELNRDFKAVAVYIKKDGKIPAGEIGYFIGKTYTSLSGFSLKDKCYNNYGKAQLVMLAKVLEGLNVEFWNLGHPFMKYKIDLGAKVYPRDEFLKRWEASISNKKF